MKKAFLLSLALLMGLTLVACGKKDENQNEIIDQFEEEKENKDEEDSYLNFNLESTDDKTVLTYTDTVKVVYYHDNEKILDMEEYIDCGSKEAAEILLNTYKMTASQETGIDSVDMKGQYIIINFNEEGYEATTLEELKDLEEQYSKLQDLYNQVK